MKARVLKGISLAVRRSEERCLSKNWLQNKHLYLKNASKNKWRIDPETYFRFRFLKVDDLLLQIKVPKQENGAFGF